MSQVSSTVLDKAFLVLETLTELGEPAPLKMISEKTELHKATVHRILTSLTDLGYVAQETGGTKYSVTPRLAHLGRNTYHDDLIAWALPFMERLHAQFNETVNLGVLEGSHVQYLHFIETTKALRWVVKPGGSDPYYSTALGRAVVAFLDEDTQSDLITRTKFEPRTLNTVSTKAELMTILHETKERGWSRELEENDLGVLCFGVPLLADGVPVAALSLSLPKSRLTPAVREQLIEALLDIKARSSASTEGAA